MENAVRISPPNCRGSPCEPPRPVPVPRACGSCLHAAVQQNPFLELFRRAAFLIAKSNCKRPSPRRPARTKRKAMLNLVVTLLIIALIAAVLGFGGGAAVGIAKVVFLVALVLFVVAAI